MPIPKKLSCTDVGQAIDLFKEGHTVKSIAEQLNVTRLTITRVLRGETYQDCTKVYFSDEVARHKFLEGIDDMMKQNQRRSRGQGKKVTS